MPGVLDVAKYILEEYGEMTTMKLQKLVYYSQAYNLAWFRNPIFNQEIKAWTHGPVVYELYNVHRGMLSIRAEDVVNGHSDQLSSTQKKVIDAVCKVLGQLTGWELRNRTHEEAPWKENFHEADQWHNTTITHQEMLDFYSS